VNKSKERAIGVEEIEIMGDITIARGYIVGTSEDYLEYIRQNGKFYENKNF
jgi:hypothetical protein